jgi:hypothetical protein
MMINNGARSGARRSRMRDGIMKPCQCEHYEECDEII